MVEVFYVLYFLIKVDIELEIIEDERIVLFDNLYSYCGDCFDYVLCLIMICVYYKDCFFLVYIMRDIVWGDVLIDNVGYG